MVIEVEPDWIRPAEGAAGDAENALDERRDRSSPGWRTVPRKRKKDAVYTIRTLLRHLGPISNWRYRGAICRLPQKGSRPGGGRKPEPAGQTSPPRVRRPFPPSASWRVQRQARRPAGGSDAPQIWAAQFSRRADGCRIMKNRLHAIFTEEGNINIIMSMYRKGARYKDIATETGLSIPSVQYRLLQLCSKGLVEFKPRYRSHTKRRR
jgi:Winged helix-turn-helix DNA-binding